MTQHTLDDATDDDSAEPRHTVTESADKIRVKTKVKRGTGTRDQDELEVVVKGDDPEDVVGDVNETVALLRETAGTVRAIQPDADDEEDGDD